MNDLDQRFFDERPRRTQTCPRCNGCGEINDAYSLAYNGKFIPGAPIDAVCAWVVGSFDIFTACREAVALAKRSERPVAFEFIDHVVVVRAHDDSDKVARAWWHKQYNETPEETAARR